MTGTPPMSPGHDVVSTHLDVQPAQPGTPAARVGAAGSGTPASPPPPLAAAAAPPHAPPDLLGMGPATVEWDDHGSGRVISVCHFRKTATILNMIGEMV